MHKEITCWDPPPVAHRPWLLVLTFWFVLYLPLAIMNHKEYWKYNHQEEFGLTVEILACARNELGHKRNYGMWSRKLYEGDSRNKKWNPLVSTCQGITALTELLDTLLPQRCSPKHLWREHLHLSCICLSASLPCNLRMMFLPCDMENLWSLMEKMNYTLAGVSCKCYQKGHPSCFGNQNARKLPNL